MPEAAKDTLDTTEAQTITTPVVRRGRPPTTAAVVQESSTDLLSQPSPTSEVSEGISLLISIIQFVQRKKASGTSPVKKSAKETPKSDVIQNPIGTAVSIF